MRAINLSKNMNLQARPMDPLPPKITIGTPDAVGPSIGAANSVLLKRRTNAVTIEVGRVLASSSLMLEGVLRIRSARDSA